MVEYINNSGFQQFSAAKDAEKKSKYGPILVWVIIAILAGYLISNWMAPKQLTVNNEQLTEVVQQVDAISNVPATAVGGDKIDATVRGIRLSGIVLKDFADEKSEGGTVLLLGKDDNTEFAEIGILANGTTAPGVGTVWKLHSEKDAGAPITMTWRNADGVEFARKISVENYIITVRDEVVNNTRRDFSVAPYARIVRHAGGNATTVATGGIARANGDIERETWKSIGKKSYVWTTPAGFAGFADQYWETILNIDSGDQTIKLKPLSDGRLQAETAAAAVSVPAGKTVTLTAHIFAGPKSPDILAAADAAIPGINQTIDYGWFWFLARPFLWAINALHGIVGNYGVAIIIFTILIRILMWPLTKKSFTGMAAMQKMQPEMQRIQKTYANDKIRMQQEMMALYKRTGSSPMSGCLPMILQIPIFFALYKALLISVPMRSANFLWITDLAAMDPYFILPVLMGATMWVQQKMQSSAATATGDNPAAQMQKMMKYLPLIFTAMFAWMPAGLVLYWTVSNMFGLGQTWWIKRSAAK